MGAVVPCPADHGDADRDAISGDGAADGRCGPTKRRLPFGASEPGAKKCTLCPSFAFDILHLTFCFMART